MTCGVPIPFNEIFDFSIKGNLPNISVDIHVVSTQIDKIGVTSAAMKFVIVSD